MIIGTDLSEKRLGIPSVVDALELTFSIKPYSIPFTSKYGIEINATSNTLEDVANIQCNTVVNNLGISNLSVLNITGQDRRLRVNLDYSGIDITQYVNYTLNGGR